MPDGRPDDAPSSSHFLVKRVDREEIAYLNAYVHVLALGSITLSKTFLKVACKVCGNILASNNRLLPSLPNQLKAWRIITMGSFA